jgi:hypothetical protein
MCSNAPHVQILCQNHLAALYGHWIKDGQLPVEPNQVIEEGNVFLLLKNDLNALHLQCFQTSP